MVDLERIQRLAAMMGNRSDSLELVRQMRCGGKKYPGGGKFFRTNLQNESPLMYQPMVDINYPIETPLRFRPKPDLGDYRAPESTGMVVNYPVLAPREVGVEVPAAGYGVSLPAESSVSVLDPVKDAARRIMAVENSKASASGGWDAKTGRWYPHKSIEGGADTIAYGIKLSNGTPEAALALKQGYLTDEQATQFADTLAQRYYDAAKRVYDKKYGEGEWDKLSDWSQSILTDFSYNPGLGKYPKLMEGFHSGDMDTILSEYKRYSNGKELGRNKVIREELDTLGAEHPIFRGEGGVLYGFGGKRRTKTPQYNPRTDTTTKLNDDPYVQEYFQYDVEPRYLREHNWTTEKERDALSNAYGNTPSSISAGLEDNVMGQANLHPNVIASGIPLTGILNNMLNQEPYITYNQNDGDPRRSTVVHENTHILRQQGISDASISGGANHQISGIPPIIGSINGSGYNNTETDYLNDAYDLSNYDFGVKQGIWHDINQGYKEAIESGATNTELRYVLWRELYTKLGRRPTIEEMDDYISNYNEEQLMNRLRNQNGYGNKSAKEQPDAGPIKDALIHVAEANDTYLIDPNLAASGGKIRIKPENRGKFTALKKRTGHSASWFKAHGTPAQKKMAVFALNARKWKHENGGYMNRYDGETEETGWLRRLLNTPTMVPNMTGTATAAATGLRDIPLTESTVGNELAVAGTALASPFVMSAPQFAGNAINWIYNPANQILATKLAVPLLGGAAVEEGVRSYTPYSGVGNLLYNAPTVPWSNWSPAYSQARRGAPQWERNLTEGILGFANPGYLLSPELMAPAMEKVMQGYAGDVATHIIEPLKKGRQYAKDWYDFVVRGNDARYRNALNNVMDLKMHEQFFGEGLQNLEDRAARFPKYSINVKDASANAGDAAASSMRLYPSEVSYGSDRIPMVVEDIGTPGNTKVTYLRPVPDSELPSLTPNEYEQIMFENAGRPSNNIYRPTAVGDEYVSPLTGETRRIPASVLDKPEPHARSKFITIGGDDEFVERYGKEVTGGAHIPVQRGEASGAAKIAKHIDEDVMPLVGDDVALTGSTVLYKNGILSGKPGDYEFLVSQEDLPVLEKKLQLTGSYDNGFALEGNSPLLRPGNGPHNVDAQVVRMDMYGEANGKVAWSLFKTMHPEEYEAQAANSIGLNKSFYDMHIINPSTGLPYKPKELIAEFKNGKYETQHVVNEAMAISKQYNKATKGTFPGSEQAAIDLLKQDRALSLLTSKDPVVKNMVRKAIDDNAYTSLGANYIHGHDFFPSLDFGNVENNKAFLRHLNINPKNVADDPEMMRNIFDQWFLVRTSRYREVSNMPNIAGVKRAVGTGNVPMGGGSATASGRNTVTGGYYGATVGDPQRGMFQQMPTYRTEMSDMTDMDEIMKMFKRTEEGYKFTSQEAKELNDELVSIFTDMQNDMSLREGGIGRNGAKKILRNLQAKPIKSLSELDEFFNKGRGELQNNGLSDLTASDIIQRISEKLDIPEFLSTGRWNYQHKYAGIWNRKAPNAASYRYVSDFDWKPFEVGRDFGDFGVQASGQSGTENLSLSESGLLPDAQSRYLMEAIYDGGYHGADINALHRAGAKPIYSDEATNALKEQLERIFETNRVGGQELGYLQRYSDMPFSGRRIKNIEYETGLNYRDGRVAAHTERIGGRSKESIMDEIIKTAPFDKKYGYIQDVKARYDGGFRVKAVTDNGSEVEYIVTRDKSNKNAWKWEVNNAADDLPFALGGYMGRINSKYGNDPDKIRQIFANVRSRQKK